MENNAKYSGQDVENLHISKCYECGELSIWIHDRLIHPLEGKAPLPNPDLSDDIRQDYEEASRILDLSPRGAAALLRLAIQKLCKELGEPGKNIDADIASLVKKGLDRRIQKALDVIRVTGNEAVHPGQIDLRDDRASAENLFKFLNLIAEKMISEEKSIEDAYAGLPETKRLAIERRDAPRDGDA